jgi:hypothetical protein
VLFYYAYVFFFIIQFEQFLFLGSEPPDCGVMTEAPRAAAAPPIEEEDAVVIVCGRCKQTFSDTKLFLRHKVQEYECLAVGQQHQDLVISSATQQQMRQKSADAPDANKSGYLQSPTNNFQVLYTVRPP